MKITFFREKVCSIIRTFDEILIHAVCGKMEDEILDEELEVCQALTDRIVKSIINKGSFQDVVKILETGESAYGCFFISFPEKKSKEIAEQLWKYKADVQKYIKSAKQETIDYPESEVKRLHKIEEELDNCLEYAGR